MCSYVSGVALLPNVAPGRVTHETHEYGEVSSLNQRQAQFIGGYTTTEGTMFGPLTAPIASQIIARTSETKVAGSASSHCRGQAGEFPSIRVAVVCGPSTIDLLFLSLPHFFVSAETCEHRDNTRTPHSSSEGEGCGVDIGE